MVSCTLIVIWGKMVKNEKILDFNLANVFSFFKFLLFELGLEHDLWSFELLQSARFNVGRDYLGTDWLHASNAAWGARAQVLLPQFRCSCFSHFSLFHLFYEFHEWLEVAFRANSLRLKLHFLIKHHRFSNRISCQKTVCFPK